MLNSRYRSFHEITHASQHLFSAEPATEPALCFSGALQSLLIESVYGSVDLFPGAVEVFLGLSLRLLVLLPCLCTVLFELLFGFLRFGPGLVCLRMSITSLKRIEAQ